MNARFIPNAISATVLILAASATPIASFADPLVVPTVKTTIIAKQVVKDVLFYPGYLEQKTVDVLAPLEGVVMSTQKEMGERVERGAALALISNDNPAFSSQPQPVVAPVNGIVQIWIVHPGERVQKSSRMAVLATGMSRVVVELTGSDGVRVKVGQKAHFTPSSSDPGAGGATLPVFSGRVTAVSPTVDPVTNTRRCELTLASGATTPSGGSVGSVLLEIASRQAVLVEAAAVLSDGASSYVYVYKAGKASVRKVDLGSKHGLAVEVRQGLAVGDALIAKTAQPLIDGQAVSLTTAQAAN